MPEDSKKTTHKGKHDAKDQRKPRQSRQYATEKAEKKVEKKAESKVAVPSKPEYEDPGPEFYQNLKRETDEILKITEEANSKYKKKEIQSNWTKYEMPIESYEEMVEQENLGADYEKLVQAPLSLGGHFQFKHEKNWDVDTGPSLYDKYFEIDMENLATAINTVPFYERNNIDQSVFNKSDVLTMNNRAIKYKRKYYNDKSYTTTELEGSDNILRLLRDSVSEENVETEISEKKTSLSESEKENLESTNSPEIAKVIGDTDLGSKNNDTKTFNIQDQIVSKLRKDSEKEDITKDVAELQESNGSVKVKTEEIDDIDDLLLGCSKTTVKPNVKETKTVEIPSQITASSEGTDFAENPPTGHKPFIESPEDLEKWLDDFLDG